MLYLTTLCWPQTPEAHLRSPYCNFSIPPPTNITCNIKNGILFKNKSVLLVNIKVGGKWKYKLSIIEGVHDPQNSKN